MAHTAQEGAEVQAKTLFPALAVKGFRRLRDVSLPLRPLTVLIGANGVGKTSILDVLSMLAKSAKSEMNAAISELSGLAAILTYDGADDLCLSTQMEVKNSHPLNYEVCLKPQGAGYLIEKESLSQVRSDPSRPFKHIDSRATNIRYFEMDQSKLVQPNWDYNFAETSLSQVPKMFREPEEMRKRLSSLVRYHALNVDPRSPVRLPQPMRPATLPGTNGEDLVSCLFYLRETDRDRFEAVEDSVRAAFPSFDRLDFPPVAAGTLAMTWRDRNFSKPLFMHQISEGMLRFLWLVTLLQSPGLTALTLIDEPEISLHPELLRLLAALLREASRRTQIVVATHSDRLIRFLEPSEVAVMDSDDDGFASVQWADTLDLEEWLKDYCLDELWIAGRLGARS